MKNKLSKILPAVALMSIVVVSAGMYVRSNGNPFIKVSLNKEAKNYVRQIAPKLPTKYNLAHRECMWGITTTLLYFWRIFPTLMMS